MERIMKVVFTISKVLYVIAGAALTFIMLLTVADVVFRAGGYPIMGTYEIVGLCGGVIVGFAIPLCSWQRGHVFMEVVIDRVSPISKNIMNTITRFFCIILFVYIGINLFQIAWEFQASGEVSPTLQIPLFPMPYALSGCCFFQCIVLICDVIKIMRGDYE